MGEARGHFQAALAIHREVGARRFEGQALDNLARLCFTQGEMEAARAHFEAALAIHREVGNRRAEGIVLGHLSSLHLEESRIEAARELLSKGETLLRTPEYRIELGKLLCTRAELERRTGDASAALKTLGEIEGIAAQSGARPDSELARSLAALSQALAGGHPR